MSAQNLRHNIPMLSGVCCALDRTSPPDCSLDVGFERNGFSFCYESKFQNYELNADGEAGTRTAVAGGREIESMPAVASVSKRCNKHEESQQQRQLTEPVLNNSLSVMLVPSTPPPTPAPIPPPCPPFVELLPAPTPDKTLSPAPPPREDAGTTPTPLTLLRSPCTKEGGGIPLK